MPAFVPQTQVIRKVLSPALGLWLRAQLESVEQLQFKLEGSDRQLLSGQIPQVFVFGDTVVYQGLRLSRIEVTGQNICINLRQVLRGKALQLLQPITVWAEVLLREADLNACLRSPLLAKVLTDLLDQWLHPLTTEPALRFSQSDPHQWQQIQIRFDPDRLHLSAILVRPQEPALSVAMGAIVELVNPNTIVLNHLQWHSDAPLVETALAQLPKLSLDLGTDVGMEGLQVEAGQVICRGKILIRP